MVHSKKKTNPLPSPAKHPPICIECLLPAMAKFSGKSTPKPDFETSLLLVV